MGCECAALGGEASAGARQRWPAGGPERWLCVQTTSHRQRLLPSSSSVNKTDFLNTRRGGASPCCRAHLSFPRSLPRTDSHATPCAPPCSRIHGYLAERLRHLHRRWPLWRVKVQALQRQLRQPLGGSGSGSGTRRSDRVLVLVLVLVLVPVLVLTPGA